MVPMTTWLVMLQSILLLLLLPIQFKVYSSPLSSSSSLIQNPLACTFNDDSTGFYASWHSNCSGIINFVVNVRNFPRPELPSFGFFRDASLFGHFWTAIGFKLISTELALIENLPGAFVSVSPARLDQAGLPPSREFGGPGGILINPRGSFFGSTLEATFGIDQSLLGNGCNQFLFFTAPTPIGAPYGAVPYSKVVCDVAKTCARYQCAEFGDDHKNSTKMTNNGLPLAPSQSQTTNIRLIKKRQSTKFNGFSSLQGTAYEGQDKPFQRMPPFPVLNTRYEALDQWRASRQGRQQPTQLEGQQQQPQQHQGQPTQWRPIEQGATNRSQMYWPYRTAIGAESANANANTDGGNNANANNILLPKEQLLSPMSFYDPANCDGGIDPAWCSDYIRQFVGTTAAAGKYRDKKAVCPSLIDSLRQSNHHCCNGLRRMDC